MSYKLTDYGFTQGEYNAFCKALFPNTWIRQKIDSISDAQAFEFVCWKYKKAQSDLIDLANTTQECDVSDIRRAGQEVLDQWSD